MTRIGKYPQEVRERAVRMVFDHANEHPSQWSAICSIPSKFSISAETLRLWVRRARSMTAQGPGSPARSGSA